VDLRVHGDGVNGHDLDAGVAGSLLVHFSELVTEVANRSRSIRHAPRLFLSPEVAAGSTILTVFGSPLERPQDEEPLRVFESPLDQTMVQVFGVLDRVAGLDDESRATDIQLERHVGDRVFGLANELLDHELDLDVNWTRVTGVSKAAVFDRPAAKRVRSVLDRPIEVVNTWTDAGILTAISLDGMIRVRVSGRKWSVVEVEAPETELENLRQLFGREVTITYRRVAIRHPSRSRDDVRHEFVEIGPWQPGPTAETFF